MQRWYYTSDVAEEWGVIAQTVRREFKKENYQKIVPKKPKHQKRLKLSKSQYDAVNKVREKDRRYYTSDVAKKWGVTIQTVQKDFKREPYKSLITQKEKTQKRFKLSKEQFDAVNEERNKE